MADTYGGYARHGGGSFSGKDATKVDRSGAYMARYIAKNIVAAQIAQRCEVQLSYAIGLSEPISVFIDTFKSGKTSDDGIAQWIMKNIDMRPEIIIRKFGLRMPVYEKLSCYGHFGENARGMLWEQTDMADMMKKEISNMYSYNIIKIIKFSTWNTIL
jgi:S-adenosylmethionine synthetase